PDETPAVAPGAKPGRGRRDENRDLYFLDARLGWRHGRTGARFAFAHTSVELARDRDRFPLPEAADETEVHPIRARDALVRPDPHVFEHVRKHEALGVRQVFEELRGQELSRGDFAGVYHVTSGGSSVASSTSISASAAASSFAMA